MWKTFPGFKQTGDKKGREKDEKTTPKTQKHQTKKTENGSTTQRKKEGGTTTPHTGTVKASYTKNTKISPITTERHFIYPRNFLILAASLRYPLAFSSSLLM